MSVLITDGEAVILAKHLEEKADEMDEASKFQPPAPSRELKNIAARYRVRAARIKKAARYEE
jgi:hypothetical protein